MIVYTGPTGDKRQVEIKFPEGKQRIGVMLSGGADSAILLYMLALERKMAGSNQEIITFTVARPDGAWDYVEAIVDKINAMLAIDLSAPIQVGDATLHHSKQGRSGELEARSKYNIDHFYYGSQQHPPKELIELPGDYPNRPDKIELPGTTIPFALVDKRHTLGLYEVFQAWPLIELTHSCTALTKGRCGECYNCKEREWAFVALDVIDSGSM